MRNLWRRKSTLTTRQDIQIHGLSIQNLIIVLELLLEKKAIHQDQPWWSCHKSYNDSTHEWI